MMPMQEIPKMNRCGRVTGHRGRRQGGQEFMEFGLVLLIYTPLLLGTFVIGMNLIKTVQAKTAIRDIADMYIHGADFSDGGYQTLAKTLANGLNLQSPIQPAGTQTRDDTAASGGDGIVWISKLMYVGAGGGTNAGNFVFLQRIRIGNTGLITGTHVSLAGDPAVPAADFLADGEVDTTLCDPRNNAAAKVIAAPQAVLKSVWITPPAPRTSLIDGQLVYMVEGYFQTPQFSMGTGYNSGGVYARYFF